MQSAAGPSESTLAVRRTPHKVLFVIEPGEDRGFVAHVPALRGCWSQGSTRDEAISNVREAIEAWLETEQDKPERSGPAADIELLNV